MHRYLTSSRTVLVVVGCLAAWQVPANEVTSEVQSEARRVNPSISTIRGEVDGISVSNTVAPGERVVVTAKHLGGTSGKLKAAWKVGRREVTVVVPIHSWHMRPSDDKGADAGTLDSAASQKAQVRPVQSAPMKSQARRVGDPASSISGKTASLLNPYHAIHEITARMPKTAEIGEVDDLKLELWLEPESDPPSSRKRISWAYVCKYAADCGEGRYCDGSAGICGLLTYSCAGAHKQVLRRSDGVERDCTPYRCDPELLKCHSSCNTQGQCVQRLGFVCASDGTCRQKQ